MSEQKNLGAVAAAEQQRLREEQETTAIAEQIDRANMAEDPDAVLAKPIPVTPVPVVDAGVADPSVAGMQRRITWTAEVVDFPALIKYVAQYIDQLPQVAAMLQPAQTALNNMARQHHEGLKVPGLRAVSKSNYATAP